MAGTKNVYNSDPLEIVIEALEKSFGIQLQRDYVTLSLTPISGSSTLVTISPKTVNGFSPYVDPISLTVNKLNLQAFLPKDMCYSGQYPITFTLLTNFMLASYGLLVRSGEWELVHGSDVFTVDESLLFDGDLSTDRYITLRPAMAHPIFTDTMTFKMLVTKDTLQPLKLSLVGPTVGTIGEDGAVTFQATGGLAPYTYQVVDGSLPLPLNGDGTGMEGEYTTTGLFEYSVLAIDSTGQTAQADSQVQVDLAGFVLNGNAPDGVVHEVYSFQYQFAGGMYPYTLIRVESLPVGLDLTPDGLLYGLPDEGDGEVRAVFQDALGSRFTLVDSIHIEGRGSEVVREVTKAALVDWLELSAGYTSSNGFQSYPEGTQWSSVDLVHRNVRLPQGAAVELQHGYLIKTSPQEALQGIGVVLYAKRGDMTPGSCLFSTMDSDSGFEINVSDMYDTRLRVLVKIDGQTYGFETPDILSDTLSMVTVQAAEGYLSVHHNEQLIQWVTIPKTPDMVTGDNPFTIGRRSDFPSGYQWNGALARVLVFNQRLMSDQVAYLCNGGYGISYRELQVGYSESVNYKIALSTSFSPATVGNRYDEEMVVFGATPLYAPLLIEGELPPGLTLDASDLRSWIITGTPSESGTYVSYWTVQGPEETAVVRVEIVVS